MADPDYLKWAIRIEDLEQEVERLTVLNKNMHTCVSGYLFGADWEHWQEFNEPKFTTCN